MPQSRCFYDMISVAFTRCSHAGAAAFRYTEFSSRNSGVTAKDTRLCSPSRRDGAAHPFLFALRWQRLLARWSKNRKKGITQRKSRKGTWTQLQEEKAFILEMEKYEEQRLKASHVSIYQRRADLRSCLMIKGTCNLGCYKAALSCF